MPSWKQRHAELADAVREEREARKEGGQRLRDAVDQVSRLLTEDPEEEPSTNPAEPAE